MRTGFSQEIPSTFRSLTYIFLISQIAATQRTFMKDSMGKKKELQSVLRQSWLEFCLKVSAGFHVIIIGVW